MCKVRINNEYSTEFAVNTGVRQGDGLSPFLFNLVIEKALKKVKECNPGLKVGTKIKILAYADDITLMAEDEEGLRNLAETLKKKAKKLGLEISEQKTKYVVVGKNTGILQDPLKVGTFSFKKCHEFKYLGVTLDQNNLEETEINTRILNGNKSYWSLKN